MIISCALVSPTNVSQIVEWREAAHRLGIVDPIPHQTGHPE